MSRCVDRRGPRIIVRKQIDQSEVATDERATRAVADNRRLAIVAVNGSGDESQSGRLERHQRAQEHAEEDGRRRRPPSSRCTCRRRRRSPAVLRAAAQTSREHADENAPHALRRFDGRRWRRRLFDTSRRRRHLERRPPPPVAHVGGLPLRRRLHRTHSNIAAPLESNAIAVAAPAKSGDRIFWTEAAARLKRRTPQTPLKSMLIVGALAFAFCQSFYVSRRASRRSRFFSCAINLKNPPKFYLRT